MRPEHQIAAPVVGNFDPVAGPLDHAPLGARPRQRRELRVFKLVRARGRIGHEPSTPGRRFRGRLFLLLPRGRRRLSFYLLLGDLRGLRFYLLLLLRLLLLRRSRRRGRLLRFRLRPLRFGLRLRLRLRLARRRCIVAATYEQGGARTDRKAGRAPQQRAPGQSRARHAQRISAEHGSLPSHPHFAQLVLSLQ